MLDTPELPVALEYMDELGNRDAPELCACTG